MFKIIRTHKMKIKFFTIFLFSFFLFSIIIITGSVDTLTTTQIIADGNSLVSSGGSFELGFFSPATSSNRYLGVWYKKISTGTVAWVANRGNPITDKLGVLMFNPDGNLVLTNSSNMTIWSSNSSGSVQNPVAQLLDSGNLVVRAVDNQNPSNFIWQSFDYPSDTFLPGMKLGMNTANGKDWFLTSWNSKNDPAKGDFTFRIDPRGFPQLVLLKGTDEEFRSGPWNGVRFSGAPGLRPNSIYTYDFIFNQDEMYYTYELINSSVYSRLVLGQIGILQRFTWNYNTKNWTVYINAPADNCDGFALCHAYGSCDMGNSPVCGCLSKFVPLRPNDWATTDWSGGCVRKTPLDCIKGDGFLKYSNIKLPDTRNSWFNRTMNFKDCQRVCLENCTCMAFANLDIRKGGSGCLLWFGELIDIREISENGEDIYIRMAYSELDSTGKKRMRMRISLALLTAILLLGLSLLLYIWKKNKKTQQQRKLQSEARMGHSSEQYNSNENQNEDLELPLFDFATVSKATSNFCLDKKLGEGGFGPVYQGVLEDGQEIAVKRLSKDSKQGLDEFKNEVICIAKLQHRNLVKLLGCCIEGEEKMLIYEYMPNKSLDFFIFDKTRITLLEWPKRFNIINGIARGLLYLHQDSRLRIIHRDLKASNILLDKDMNPKISDFGLARSVEENETEGNTKRVVGTHGYMSPEYAVDGQFSVKSDVFSFGVLVLEIVNGRRNRGFYHPSHNLNLLGHAWRLYEEGRSMELIDAHLSDSCYLSEVLRSIHVGLLCVQQSPEDRPRMSSVVLMLGSDSALPPPKQPGFFTERNIHKADSSSSKNATHSGNEITITLLAAR